MQTSSVVLLKVSGEALSDENNIISPSKISFFAEEIKKLLSLKVKVAIVVGGGNILRGERASEFLAYRYQLDNMGMLSTVINSIALEGSLLKLGVNAKALSVIEMNKIIPFYNVEQALSDFKTQDVLICAGGIANPYFSTDTASLIRALELNASIILKGTQVEGVYSDDPKINSEAVFYEKISYDQIISDNLKILDHAAVVLAKKNHMPIRVFNIHVENNMEKAFKGEIGTLVSN